jgi:MFS family permease
MLLPVSTGSLRIAWQSRVGGLPREFWFLWAGTFVNRLGSFVQPFLVLYLTGERGLSASTAGLVMALYGGGGIASQIVGGVLADRIGRPKTILLGMWSFAASLSILGLANALTLVILGALLTGMTADLHRPAAQALIADVVPPEDRARAFGLNFWAVNLGFAVATTLAGFMASRGYGLLFAGDAFTSVVCGYVVYRNIGETRPKRSVGHRDGSMLEVLRDPLMVRIIISWLLYAIVYFQIFITLPLAMDADGLSTDAYGVAVSVNGIVIVLLQPITAVWLNRVPRVPAVAVSMAIVGIGFGLGAYADTMISYVLTILVWTFGEIGVAAVGAALIADIAPPTLRGRYAGAWGLSFGGAAVIGPIAGTQAYDHLGAGAVWGGCLVVGLAAAALTFSMRAAVARRTASVAAATTPDPVGP